MTENLCLAERNKNASFGLLCMLVYFQEISTVCLETGPVELTAGGLVDVSAIIG